MAVDERRRKNRYEALEQRIGSEAADTMMELLPPVGWADVATKQDLGRLEDRIDARMERGFRRMTQWNVGVLLAVAAIAFSAARLM